MYWKCTRAVCKVRGLALLLRVVTSWRCGDGLFFQIPPLASDALLTTLHPLLENVLQTVDHLEIFFLGAPFSWMEKPRNRMGRDLNWILCSASKKCLGGSPLEHPPYSPDLAPCDLWAFPTMKRELRGDQRSAARLWVERCKSASLAKGGASKKRPSPHLHKVPTRSNKASPRTFQTALVI
jgi:hypothetical protein